MDKLTLFIKAIEAKRHFEKDWVISAFSVMQEGADEWKKDPYPYRIVQSPTGNFFVTPGGTLEQIELSVPNEPIYKFKDKITLQKGTLPNIKEDSIVTTYGNLFFNAAVIVYSFGEKINFINGPVNGSKLEDLITPLIVDNPEEGGVYLADKIYIDEYLKFVNSIYELTKFSQLCVWGATEKTMTPPPGIVEYRKKLLEENKDRLHDPAVIAAIDAKLIAFDAEYLKGDPGENFLISGKSRKIVRKKLFLMVGAETGLDDNVGVDLIDRSLSEGWDINKFPEMNNTQRAGSFLRGAETQLGGESVKWLLRASSNITVNKDDCGTTLGVKMVVSQDNFSKLVGFTVIGKDNKQVTVTSEEQAGTYIGKILMRRSPMYCRLGITDYCKLCVGSKLSSNETGLSMAVSEYGSAFLSISLKGAHAKGLNLARMDIDKSIF